MSRIDIYHSRRAMFNYCTFWIRNEDGVGNSEEYIYKRQPSGCFYAKEVESENDDQNIIMGTFLADSHSIMLESRDDLSDMTENSLVRYKNLLWRVENIQKQLILKESEFCAIPTYNWFIRLIR